MTVPIEVKGGQNLPDVAVTFFMTKMLNAEQEQYLERLIDGWYNVGAHGGYGGKLHFLHDIIFDDEQTIYVAIDLGDAPVKALDILYQIVIDALSMYQVQVDKIEVE